MKAIKDALCNLDIGYSIKYVRGNPDGENSCFIISFNWKDSYEDGMDIENCINASSICSEYDLYYFWDGDLHICTNGWD